MKEKTGIFTNVFKSGFMRSVIARVLAIFIIVCIIIASAAFYSFTSEIRQAILLDRQKQLDIVEETITLRMEEVTSIAYNVGQDPVFYLEPVENADASSREMTATLSRYLVGNNFIEHLAYCRVAEPDILYTAGGERSLSEFFVTALGMEKSLAAKIIQDIHKDTATRVLVMGGGDNMYFAYSYPLPQLASKPLAHVLMMIPVDEIKPLFETLLVEGNGKAAVYSADGGEIYSIGGLSDDIDLTDFVKSGSAQENYKSPSGERYVLQKVSSEINGWTYVSAIRYSDTISGLANTQLVFIALVVFILIAAIFLMLVSIVVQYKPIRNLAEQVAETKTDGAPDGQMVDERILLSDTIAALRGDSEQKQKYESAYYEADAASKAKSSFLSSMSHDIRTPMNAIVGMTALARKHIGDEEYVDDCLKKVQLSSNYLLDIINNVLDMSRIESGRIPIAEEVVLIPALVDNLVSLIASSVEAKAQTLDVEIEKIEKPVVIGDSIHMVQVFVNILSNAVKFTPEGGKLELRVRQLESDDEQYGSYVFSFTDTGIGISPEFIDHVFDTFSRDGSLIISKTEGTGLGMAIAKKLVELMGGTISCESELGKGTTFTVVMRMKYADEQEAASFETLTERRHAVYDGDETVNLTGKRVLLAEDNAMNREIACRIIGETGAKIVEANDGKEAVEAFESNPEGYFDLIFMDIQMPVMNGYEATNAIRSMNRADAKSVLIYAMTANAFDEDVRLVKNAGMNGHIGKPYNPTTLYAVLAEALAK